MAAKRMFSIDVIDTDKFLDMPVSTQALYFHFGMRADDDGFVSSPKKIVKIANCTNDDLRILISKGYVIPFDSGVVVITDWRVNNSIRSDRYKPTIYQEELKQLETSKNTYLRGSVGIPIDNQCVTREQPEWNQNGYQMDTQVRLDKDSIDKNSIYIKDMYPETEVSEPPTPKKKTKTTRFIPPTVEEVRRYCQENNYSVDAERFVDFYECKGWMVLSCCLARSLMVKYGLQMRFITAPDYIDVVGEKIKRTRGEADPSQIYRKCKVLVLDDLGAQVGNDWHKQEMFRLVNSRMEEGNITIFTSNFDANDLNVDARTKDRIIKSSIVLQMPEESIRRKKADMEQQRFLQDVLRKE